MFHSIKEGAIFISDAHESDIRESFYEFLLLLESKEIKTPQLFLMGDMFDLLVGKVAYGVSKYTKHIELLEKLAQRIEIFYFEGNHDFCLDNLFLHVKVIPLSQQPLQFNLNDKKSCLLSHGDKYGGLFHMLFTKFIRSKSVLSVLNFIDVRGNFAISKKIEKGLLHKNICKKIHGFEQIIKEKILTFYPRNSQYILEGHYHQNEAFEINGINYINFPSFACNQSYFIVESSTSAKFAEKKLRGCNV
jgi:UDP-2,3-diacylglucosamine hydrolase